jgi:hypothetical protein
VAKRSVKRERLRAQQEPSNGPRPRPEAAPSRGPGRSFWLGVLAAAAVLIPAGIVAVAVASGSDEDPQAAQEAAFDEAVQSEAERLREQTQVRDREQVEDLTGRMRQMVEDLQPVLAGLARTFPPGADDRTGRLVPAAQLDRWRGPLREADRYFENPPSGETGTNVARGGFAASIDALVGAVDTYRLAVQAGADRGPLLERARDQRNLAIRTWSVAATQLDAINIATGFGHQHVYLGASEEVGGFGADPAPEGSGAEDGG